MKTMTIMFALAIGFLVLGCAEETASTATLDGKIYNLTSPEAQALAGGTTIPRRAEYYGLPAGNLPRPTFSTVGDWDVRSRFDQGLIAMLGIVPDDSEITDSGGELSATYASGFSVIAEGTGTHAVKRLGVPRKATVVADAEQAVDLALADVAESGLITLAEHESLDVVGVASTRYAGWVDKGGEEVEPVYFSDPSSAELLTEYKSDYTVYFGRRYRGVPIIGPPLGVRLDSDGEMAAFMKGWRDISGETATGVVLDSSVVATDASSAAEAAMDLKGTRCGFTEGIDPLQTAAGIGCALVYENTEAIGTLAEEKVEWVSLSTDASFSLGVGSD